jgi:hypothetical protein
MSANMAPGRTQSSEMQATDVASILKTVEMPTVQHLLNASLDPVRAAIQQTSPEMDPQRWVALHMILGTALRIRAPQMPLHERTQACVEALRAFECALAQCCERTTARQLRASRIGAVGTNQFSLQTSACTSGPDGVQMVVDASRVSMAEGIEMLESAIRVFQGAAERADRQTEAREWIVARSNLGCALTMLGQRTQGMDGIARIEQAIDVLRDAAAACTGEELLSERASAYVNLSEAFQAMAERAMPGERIRYVERSLDWMAAALGFFAPPEYQWLLQVDRAAFA